MSSCCTFGCIPCPQALGDTQKFIEAARAFTGAQAGKRVLPVPEFPSADRFSGGARNPDPAACGVAKRDRIEGLVIIVLSL